MAATILLVEDEQNLADLYEFWLAEEYDVRVAYSGRAGLEAADDAVDAVVLDREMPGMSGGQVLDRLRDRWPNLPVAAASASTADAETDRRYDAYLRKPIERDQLRTTIAELVD